MDHIESVLNSHEDFRIDNRLKIDVIHRRGRKALALHKNKGDAIENKRGIITIINDDNLCCAREIERGKHLAKLPNKYQMCKDANTGRCKTADITLKLEAKKLHSLANVCTERVAAWGELKQFQKVIKDFQIVVFS